MFALMRRQTRQTLESFRIDERAWIEIQPIALPTNTSASVGAFRYALYPKNVGKTSATNITIYVSALSDARFHEEVKAGAVLCARSIKPFEGGRWRLRWMRANSYGN